MSLPLPERRRRPARRHVVAALAAASTVLAGVAVAGGPLPALPVIPGTPVDVSPLNNASLTGITTAPGLAVAEVSRNALDATATVAAPDGRVLFAERQGGIKVVTAAGKTVEAGRLLTSCSAFFGAPTCVDPTLEEGGVHGIELATTFAQTGHFYAYYSAAFTAGIATADPRELEMRLSRFTLKADNTIEPTSEKVLLTVPAEFTACCHYGGDLDLMPDGTLLLTVGDDTSPRVEGWNPRDKRAGQEAYNAERTSQNRKDRRGKVLRLNQDGTVPDGRTAGVAANPHVGDPAYDPYVYAMGLRSDWRVAVDDATRAVFVGNVGPDARTADAARGPVGRDELETIPPGGGSNHGWPRCIGKNLPYKDYDYLTGTTVGTLSCEGMTPATLDYTYDNDASQAIFGSGGRTIVPGVVYRSTGAKALPARLQGSLLLMDWSRGWVIAIPVFPVGHPQAGTLDLTRMEKIVTGLRGASDMSIAPDGTVVVVEYGSGYYENTNSRIIRLVPGTGGQQGQD